jgi:Penicillin amidase
MVEEGSDIWRSFRVCAAWLLASSGLATGATAFAAGSPPMIPPVGQVALHRDIWGMAHLYADREADAYFGLGYATAEDRLQQVLFWYRYARGELAAAFGPGPIHAQPGLNSALAEVIPDTVAADRDAGNSWLKRAAILPLCLRRIARALRRICTASSTT